MYICFIPKKNRVKSLFKTHIMFGLFKKKTEQEKLQDQYEKLMREAYLLSSTNRKMSDQKTFEANQLMDQIARLS